MDICYLTYADNESISRYTDNEWSAILAQYSITYDWTDKYSEFFGTSAKNVLSNYLDSLSNETVKCFKSENVKEVTIINNEEYEKIVIDFLEQKIVLNYHQLKIIENTSSNFLSRCLDHVSNISIKETLIKVSYLVRNESLNKPLLKNSNDVLRYIVMFYSDCDTFSSIDNSILKNLNIKFQHLLENLY